LFYEVRSGDKEAEKLLLEKLRERFRLITQQRVSDSQDVEDIVQDSLVVIASKSKAMDFQTSFSAWARKVLENNILNYHRTRARQKRKLERFAKQRNSAAEENLQLDLKRRLLDCLKKLNEANIRHARILNYSHQGYSIEQICEKLQISKNAAYVLLSRARVILRNCLEKGVIEP